MEHWREALSIFGLLFGSGAVIGLLRYIIGHENKHRAIEARLEWGSKQFSENKEDHDRIESKLDVLGIGVRELLVHEGLRKPGQGINGEE